MGPSPRARGSPRFPCGHASIRGSIPACAGLTLRCSRGPPWGWVHPRVRGAHPRRPGAAEPRLGPSPRARGSLPRGPNPPPFHGSIPACAGLTNDYRSRRDAERVHPRVRGAHVQDAQHVGHGGGPSPRARGSRPGCAARRARWGSIPACAGLTDRPGTPLLWCRVHPRVRGAHAVEGLSVAGRKGPSPRARGSPLTTWNNAALYLLVISAVWPDLNRIAPGSRTQPYRLGTWPLAALADRLGSGLLR